MIIPGLCGRLRKTEFTTEARRHGENKELVYDFGMTIMAWYNSCYTLSVKTAISLPDDLFRRAEAMAHKLKMSRSQLYAKAIVEFIERRQAARITQRLNEIYSAEPAKIDPAVAAAQSKSIERESW